MLGTGRSAIRSGPKQSQARPERKKGLRENELSDDLRSGVDGNWLRSRRHEIKKKKNKRSDCRKKVGGEK